MVGRTSDVYIETHYRDGAAIPVAQSFRKMNDEVKKTEVQAKSAGKEFATFGKVIGGLVTVEVLRKLANFTVEVTKMSTEGAAAVTRLNRSWVGLEKTLGTVLATPLSGGFQEASKVLDGFAVQVEAFGVLYHKVFGGMADTPTIDRLAGIKTTPFGPKAELAEMIKQAKLDERIGAIGEQVDQQVAQEREKKKQEKEKRHQEDLRLAEKRQKEFEDLAKRLGPGTIGRNLGQTGGRPTLLAALLDPGSGAAKKAADLSGQRAYTSGGKTGEMLALGFKHGLQTNQQDFTNPADNMAFDVADRFRTGFIGVLSESYADLLSGDFTDAVTGIGTGLFTAVETGFVDELAKQTVDSKLGKMLTGYVSDGITAAVRGIGGVVSGALDTGLDTETLRRLGARAGGNLKTGVNAGFDWLLPDISTSWGPQGATFNAIKTGMTDALKGGVMGAGIGALIGDRITSEAGALGGIFGSIIGGAFGQPVVGGAIGAVLTSAMDKIILEGERQKQTGRLREFGTDVQAFGGLQGFFQRIGGFKGIVGGRAQMFGDESSRSSILDMIRLGVGATSEQAGGVFNVLRAVGQGSRDVNLSGVSMGEVVNTLRQLGISQEDINSLVFHTGTLDPGTSTGTTLPLPSSPDLTPPPPTGKPVVQPTPIEQAQALLRAAQTSGHLSASALKALGWSGVVSQAINDVGGAWPSVGSSIKTVLNSGKGYSPQDEAAIKRTMGVDIVAARGFMGTVNRPTRFLAGEAGPEDVMVIPQHMRRGITGGGSGRGGAVLNVQLQVNTPNVASMHEWARRDLYPMIRTWLMEDSNSGQPILRSRGVVQG